MTSCSCCCLKDRRFTALSRQVDSGSTAARLGKEANSYFFCDIDLVSTCTGLPHDAVGPYGVGLFDLRGQAQKNMRGIAFNVESRASPGSRLANPDFEEAKLEEGSDGTE